MSVFFESSGLLYPGLMMLWSADPGLMMLWSADHGMNPIGCMVPRKCVMVLKKFVFDEGCSLTEQDSQQMRTMTQMMKMDV